MAISTSRSFGQDGDGGGRGMDSAASLGFGDALHAVNSGFELQAGEDAAAGDGGAGLLEAADAGVGYVIDLEPPAVEFGISLVHSEQFGGEQGGFLAAGAGADFEDGVLVVGLVLGQEQQQHFAIQSDELVAQFVDFGLGEVAHLAVAAAGGFGGEGSRRR